MADFMLKRLPDGHDVDSFVSADLLCHYIASLNYLSWFPVTYVYKPRNEEFPLFDRLISLRHFEKVKILFNVKTVDELKSKLLAYQESSKDQRAIAYSGSFDGVKSIYKLINIDRIGSSR